MSGKTIVVHLPLVPTREEVFKRLAVIEAEGVELTDIRLQREDRQWRATAAGRRAK